MAGLYMNGDFVRDRMKALGLKQRDVAEALGLPQSAISNIIKGKRRIKVEEADKLIPLLGQDPAKIRELPVIPIGKIGRWLSKGEKPELYAQSNHTGVSDNSVFIELDAGDGGLLPGVLHVLVDLDKRSLYSGEVYLTEAGDDFHFYRFKEAPARLQPMPPAGSRVVLEVGQGNFIIKGQVQGVHKRPASFERV